MSQRPQRSELDAPAPAANALISRVVLVVALAGVVCAGVGAALTLAVGHTEGVDTAVFLLAFAILLPILSIVVVKGGPLERAEPQAISLIAVVSATGLTFALFAAKLSDLLVGSTVSPSFVLLAAIVALLAAVVALAMRASRGMAMPAPAAGLALFLLSAGLLILIFGWGWLSADATLLLALLLGAVLVFANGWLRTESAVGRRIEMVVDVVLVGLILLVVGDVVVLTFDAEWHRLQEHHNTFLGPVNDVIGGRVLLVDTYPVYGVGTTYFLAALFQVVPMGYGTFGLLAAGGLAVLYAAAYVLLRLAGCSQLLAAMATAAAIASSVFATMATPAAWPSVGALRWTFGFALVLLAVWSVRSTWPPLALRLGGAVIVGISSVWSFEVFVYTAATYLALSAYSLAARRPRPERLRSIVAEFVPAAAACLVAHLALAVWTLIEAGQLPEWGPYMGILREYSVGGLDRIVAPPWWLGIPAGAVLFASAVGVVAVLARAPQFEKSNRAALVAVAGLTAFGIATFTHLVRFSSSDFVARSDLTVLMLIALWVHLALRSDLAKATRTAVAASAFFLVALLIVLSWPYLEREAGRTPLIAAIPGNDSPQGVTSLLWAQTDSSSSFARAWSNPPIQPRSATAEALLEQYWPNQEQALVLLFPDLTVEALMRTGRINLLPVSSPFADDVVAEETWKRVRPAIDEIEPGTLMLTEGFYLTPGATREYLVGGPDPLDLEQMIIDRLSERFRLRRVETVKVDHSPVMGDDELVVVRLEIRD